MFRRFMFSLLSFPILVGSFFSALDVLPYTDIDLICNGKVLEITAEESAKIESELSKLIKGAKIDVGLSVMFEGEFEEYIKEGDFLNFKVDGLCDIDGMEFNELIFKVVEDGQSIELYRGIDGSYRGRCFYVESKKSTSDLYNLVQSIKENHTEKDYKERSTQTSLAVEDNQTDRVVRYTTFRSFCRKPSKSVVRQSDEVKEESLA